MTKVRIQVNYVSMETHQIERRSSSSFVSGDEWFLPHPSTAKSVWHSFLCLSYVVSDDQDKKSLRDGWQFIIYYEIINIKIFSELEHLLHASRIELIKMDNKSQQEREKVTVTEWHLIGSETN